MRGARPARALTPLSPGAAIDSAGGAESDDALPDSPQSTNPATAEAGGQSAFDGGAEVTPLALGSYADLDALADAVALSKERSADTAFRESGGDTR